MRMRPSPSTKPGSAAPAARRQGRSAWRDVRLWLGVGLVAVSMVVGARLLGGAGDAVVVWQATSDLAPGRPIDDGAVRPVAVPRAVSALGYLPASSAPTGTVTRPISRGELLPASALEVRAPEPVRHVTVAVEPDHAPVGLAAWDRVDVWVTPSTDAGMSPPASARPPQLVIAGALVVQTADDASGVGGRIAVALEVPEQRVAETMAALRAGDVDLVRVPAESGGDSSTTDLLQAEGAP